MQNDFDSFVLDTSFLSALFKKHDKFHDKALHTYKEQLADHELFIPITVIIEFTLLTPKYFKYSELSNFLKALNYKTIHLNIFFETELIELWKKNQVINLKAVDLSVLISAVNNNSQLVTFDEKLNNVWTLFNKKSNLDK